MSIHVYSLSACVSVIDSSCAIAELLSRDVNHSCRAKKRVKVAKEGYQNVLLHRVHTPRSWRCKISAQL